MSAKKVNLGRKPTSSSADAWVDRREAVVAEREPMKRLTIDIPESLHREIKAQCAMRGSKIADEVRDLLIQKYRK